MKWLNTAAGDNSSGSSPKPKRNTTLYCVWTTRHLLHTTDIFHLWPLWQTWLVVNIKSESVVSYRNGQLKIKKLFCRVAYDSERKRQLTCRNVSCSVFVYMCFLQILYHFPAMFDVFPVGKVNICEVYTTANWA